MGVGTGGYEFYSQAYVILRKYPHNLFLELLAEFGIFGLAMSAALVTMVLKQLGRCRQWRAVFPQEASYIMSLVIFPRLS